MENAGTVVKEKIDYSLCGDLLRTILAKDGWTLRRVSQSLAFAPDAVLLAQKGGRRIAFFFSDQRAHKLTAAFRTIQRRDRGQFKLLGVLIAPTNDEMQRLRSASGARKFPRAFFASLDEVREVAVGCAPSVPERSGGMMSFKADTLANIQIGGPQSPLYRLVFKAPELQEILPPQFVMMDTTPKRVPLGARTIRRGNLRGAVDLSPRPLLKRPFGICRAFLPHFASDYAKRLSLPPALALVLHPPVADYFDMLYKVLPDGIGTPLMAKLKRGQKIDMVGPLGRPIDVRRLRAEGVEEVHVIGGGVGMAPLILLVEALRYYGFPVKVFLGIAGFESIRYRDELGATFGEKVRSAYVYIDDLLAAGVRPYDLYVSCDSEAPSRIVRGIPKENLFHGLVPEQYRRFLLTCHLEQSEGARSFAGLRGTTEILRFAQNDTAGKHGSIVAFTCGPNRMMELVAEIARQAGVHLHVLLEKRMACGIGVCFSCVQKVRRPNGTEDYARICAEGPLFDAKDILWKNDDSKPTSANSCCAPRC
jgi:NAD(P)H-flavin reductase